MIYKYFKRIVLMLAFIRLLFHTPRYMSYNYTSSFLSFEISVIVITNVYLINRADIIAFLLTHIYFKNDRYLIAICKHVSTHHNSI